jgi:DNA polymerase-3 subunit chi
MVCACSIASSRTVSKPEEGRGVGLPEVWFYHLERSTLEETLPPLLEKSLQRGWRALIRVTDEARLDALDDHLWTWRDDSFLPHGREDDHAARHPVLLTLSPANANGAKIVFLVDGAEAGDLTAVERCVRLFDGRDEAAVAAAREAWRATKASGAACSYWKQDEAGRWTKAA